MNRQLKILESADYSERIENGRSSCYIIVNNKLAEDKCMFGFVELREDFDEARGLFEKAERRAMELGFSRLIGPMNYNTWMSYRWALNDFDVKYFPDCENKAYHVDFIRRLGYKELYTYRSAHVKIDNKLFPTAETVYRQKLDEGFTFKYFEGGEAYALADIIFDISKDAFSGSYLYSEISREEFREIYLSWTRLIPRLEMIVAFKDGVAAGFSMGYINPQNPADYISKTTAVRREFQHNKLYLALVYLGYKHIIGLGYSDVVYHFECEQRSTFRRFDSNTESNEKRYAVFVKELDA